MIKTRHDLTFCGTIESQFICNDPFMNETPMFDQLDQKPFCGALVVAAKYEPSKGRTWLSSG
jgi:hypothetical protein